MLKWHGNAQSKVRNSSKQHETLMKQEWDFSKTQKSTKTVMKTQFLHLEFFIGHNFDENLSIFGAWLTLATQAKFSWEMKNWCDFNFLTNFLKTAVTETFWTFQIPIFMICQCVILDNFNFWELKQWYFCLFEWVFFHFNTIWFTLDWVGS